MGANSGSLGFLVASPALSEPPFEQSVVLLLEHSAQGAMGFIVNKPLPHSAPDLVEGGEALRHLAVGYGGPVQSDIGWCLHRAPTGLAGEWPLLDPAVAKTPDNSADATSQGLWVSSSLEVLQAAAQHADTTLLLGYAGWEAGQLEEELKEGSWLWLESGPELLSLGQEKCWEAALAKLQIKADTFVGGRAEA